MRLATLHRPDVLLRDIRMPGTSGIAATEPILETVAEPCPRVLVLTTFDLDEHVYAALRAAACGLLLKDTGPPRLLAAIVAVGGGPFQSGDSGGARHQRVDGRDSPEPHDAQA